MKFIILILIFSFTLKNGICQAVTEDEIYDFINAICIPDSSKLYYLEDAIVATNTFETDGPLISGMDTIFTNKDIEAIKTQIGNYKGYLNWKKEKLNNTTIISLKRVHNIFKHSNQKTPNKKDGWSKFYTKYGDKKHIIGFFYYSMPLFSADHNKCVMYVGHSCGLLCGDWATIAYQKLNGKWVVFKVLSHLVS